MTSVRNALTGTLWPLPTIVILLAVGLAVLLPHVDEALQRGGRESLALVFGGGPGAARTVLSAIATSLISVTTLLFSLTIVTLQLASSQYSPRLLQTFVRDRVVQVCLGELLATFVYALIVLRTVRSADESGAGAFVPRLSVSVAFVLALGGVAALVTFLSHQTRQLRVETMMRDVHKEAGAALGRLDERSEDGLPERRLPAVPPYARPVCFRKGGFLVDVREQRLLETLADAGAVLRLDRRHGDPVVAGTPVGWAWTDDAARDLPVDDLEDALASALVVHYERADTAGPSNGLRKLVDIAVRSLSPGINDPTTAVHALSHISALVGEAATRDVEHRLRCDEDGTQRLAVPAWDFPALLDLAVTQIRHYGHAESAAVARLFALLAEVGWRCRTSDQRRAVRHQRDLMVAQWLDDPPPGRTSEDVRRWNAAVDDALVGRWASVND
ncbi:DUF2254 domain-containing protein [Modestobacter sp. DSM 44400]|uniref:DUF2254 domain-containing protein n=1 Tax=Modestobacter sp. DSM 44400 TaxID=1550230 RepID=UPI0015875312|nr:DUF2254 domain-containing protein [Modestobacter sp. DSM 44400]